MFRCKTSIAVLFASLWIATASQAADRVVLISWDGVRRDVLHELIEFAPKETGWTTPCPGAARLPTRPVDCGQYWTCMPNLCKFQVIDSGDVENKPLTKPQHAQMLTGYGPVETGDLLNAGSDSVPPGMTVYERIKMARPEVVTVHIAGRKYIGRSVVGNALDSGALELSLRRGSYDHPRFTGANTTDRAEAGLQYITNSESFFFFIHYKTADVVGHLSSDRGDAYREAIIANDQQLGRLLAMLEDYGMLEGTKVYVTTDHGFDGKFHLSLETPSVSQTWIASRDFDLDTTEPASILDVTPTVLDALGIETAGVAPHYRGQSRMKK